MSMLAILSERPRGIPEGGAILPSTLVVVAYVHENTMTCFRNSKMGANCRISVEGAEHLSYLSP